MAKSEQYGLKKQLLDEVQHDIMWQKRNSINAILKFFFTFGNLGLGNYNRL